MIEQIVDRVNDILHERNSWLGKVHGITRQHKSGVVYDENFYAGLDDRQGKISGYFRYDRDDDETSYSKKDKQISSRGGFLRAEVLIRLILMHDTNSDALIDMMISELLWIGTRPSTANISLEPVSSSGNTDQIFRQEAKLEESNDAGWQNEKNLVRITFRISYDKQFNCEEFNPDEC